MHVLIQAATSTIHTPSSRSRIVYESESWVYVCLYVYVWGNTFRSIDHSLSNITYNKRGCIHCFLLYTSRTRRRRRRRQSSRDFSVLHFFVLLVYVCVCVLVCVLGVDVDVRGHVSLYHILDSPITSLFISFIWHIFFPLHCPVIDIFGFIVFVIILRCQSP